MKCFNEINIDGFDISHGFKGSVVYKVGKLNNLSINKFDLNFQQIENGYEHKLFLTEISKNGSNRLVDYLI